MFLQTYVAVLVILQSSYPSSIKAAIIPCDFSNAQKVVAMTPRVDTEFNVYNICDRVRLNLPSHLPDCSSYTWQLLPDLTTSSTQASIDLPGQGWYREIVLNEPSQFGVYCTRLCTDVKEEYCAALAVAPTFDSQVMPNCKTVEGKSVQLSCTSIGYPIISKIIKKGNSDKDDDVCPELNSTANYAFLGSTAFGKLNHTCNTLLPDYGSHKLICSIAFLSWQPQLNSSFAINHSFDCNVTKGNDDGESESFKTLSSKIVGTNVVSDVVLSVTSNPGDTTLTYAVSVVAVITFTSMAVLLFLIAVVVRIRVFRKPTRDHTDSPNQGTVECAITVVGDQEKPRRMIQSDGAQVDKNLHYDYVEHDGMVRERQRIPQLKKHEDTA